MKSHPRERRVREGARARERDRERERERDRERDLLLGSLGTGSSERKLRNDEYLLRPDPSSLNGGSEMSSKRRSLFIEWP